MTLHEWQLQANQILKSAGIQNYTLDTRFLLCHYLKKDATYLLTNRHTELGDPAPFLELVRRRANCEPVGYITGSSGFMGLEFSVEPGVLIPRPDTETLVEQVVAFAGDRHLSMLELGVGSGCISVSCGYYCPNLQVTAVDVSPVALKVARQNALRHKVDGRLTLLQMDMMTDFPTEPFDLVVSNPPYIPSADLPGLMPDVRDYEPALALDGGGDGLNFYRRICQAAVLRNGGMLAFEVGCGQADDVAALMNQSGYCDITVSRDLQGIARVVHGIAKEEAV